MRKLLALTMGEPSGIGPDISLHAWAALRGQNDFAFALLADPELIAARARRLNLDISLVACNFETAASAFCDALPIISLASTCSDKPGITDSANSVAVLESIEAAFAATIDGRAGAIVTNPINKAALYEAGFEHPGHTEYLGALVEKYTGRKTRPVMMLAADDFRVVPATVHVPLKDVSSLLSTQMLIDTALIVLDELRERFGIEHPRLAVTGFNPHAGEQGLMGTEDNDIIFPAIEELQHAGHLVSGPYPADTLFHARARQTYDAALCMYHDQALIPIKTIAFDQAVNVTLGLPLVRTSPDHGTALDIAGKGGARPDSLIAALRLAAALNA